MAVVDHAVGGGAALASHSKSSEDIFFNCRLCCFCACDLPTPDVNQRMSRVPDGIGAGKSLFFSFSGTYSILNENCLVGPLVGSGHRSKSCREVFPGERLEACV